MADEVLRLRATVVSEEALADIRKIGREIGLVQQKGGVGAKQASGAWAELGKTIKEVGKGVTGGVEGFSGMAKMAGGFGLAVGAAVYAGSKLIDALGGIASKMVEMKYASKELGISEVALRAWSDEAQKAGIAPEAMMAGLGNFKRNTEDFSNNIGELRGQLVAMGAGPVLARINASGNQLDKLKAAFDFKEVLDKSDPSGMKARRFFEMIGLGADTARLSYDDFAKTMQEKKPVSEADMKKAQDYQNALVNLGSAWEELKQNVAVMAFPAVTELVKDLNSLVKGIDDVIEAGKRAGNWMERQAKPVADAVAGVGPWIDRNLGGDALKQYLPSGWQEGADADRAREQATIDATKPGTPERQKAEDAARAGRFARGEPEQPTVTPPAPGPRATAPATVEPQLPPVTAAAPPPASTRATAFTDANGNPIATPAQPQQPAAVVPQAPPVVAPPPAEPAKQIEAAAPLPSETMPPPVMRPLPQGSRSVTIPMPPRPWLPPQTRLTPPGSAMAATAAGPVSDLPQDVLEGLSVVPEDQLAPEDRPGYRPPNMRGVEIPMPPRPPAQAPPAQAPNDVLKGLQVVPDSELAPEDRMGASPISYRGTGVQGGGGFQNAAFNPGAGADEAGASRIIQIGVFDALVEFKSYVEASSAAGGGGPGGVVGRPGGGGGMMNASFTPGDGGAGGAGGGPGGSQFGGNAGATRVASGTLKGNQAEAYNSARKEGLSDSSARALVANMSGEALSKPGDVHWDSSHYAHGIVQWDDERAAAIKKQFGKSPEEMSVAEQTKAAIWEMQTNPAYAKTWAAMQSEGSTESKVGTLVENYERPADVAGATGQRVAYLHGLPTDFAPPPGAVAQNTPDTSRIDQAVAPPAPTGQVSVTLNSNGTKADAQTKTDGQLFQPPTIRQHRQMQRTEDGGLST